MEELKELKLDKYIYKRVAKKKKCILVDFKSKYLENIHDNSFVLIKTEDDKDKKKRKVNKVYYADDLEELYKTLKKKKKLIYMNSDFEYPEDKKNKKELIAIEFKHSKKIFKRGLLFILFALAMLIAFYQISVVTGRHDIKVFRENVNKLKEKEVSYVYLDFHSKMILELTGTKVTNKACLNDECINFANSLDIDEKSIKEALGLINDKAKENGIDTTGGLNVSTSNVVLGDALKDIDFINFNSVSLEGEKKLLSQVIDNEDIKTYKNKKAYNHELLEFYQKDKDYGKIYSCKEDDYEVACFIDKDYVKQFYIPDEIVTYKDLLALMPKTLELVNKVSYLLDKFEIEYTYSFEDSFVITVGDFYYKYSGAIINETSEEDEEVVKEELFYVWFAEKHLNNYEAGERERYINFTSLNLINPSRSTVNTI